jgi:hypothetical protein
MGILFFKAFFLSCTENLPKLVGFHYNLDIILAYLRFICLISVHISSLKITNET